MIAESKRFKVAFLEDILHIILGEIHGIAIRDEKLVKHKLLWYNFSLYVLVQCSFQSLMPVLTIFIDFFKYLRFLFTLWLTNLWNMFHVVWLIYWLYLLTHDWSYFSFALIQVFVLWPDVWIGWIFIFLLELHKI